MNKTQMRIIIFGLLIVVSVSFIIAVTKIRQNSNQLEDIEWSSITENEKDSTLTTNAETSQETDDKMQQKDSVMQEEQSSTESLADVNIEMTLKHEIEKEQSSEQIQTMTENEKKNQSKETDEKSQETQVVTDEDFVNKLSIANTVNQLVVVSAKENNAVVSMHQKEEKGWQCILETDAQIGANGVGKTKEGDRKTPKGVYTMSFAFGNCDNPGTALPYTQTDASWFWVDDSKSQYYNQFVSTNQVVCDWSSAEHISAVDKSYNYVIPIDYNKEAVRGAGSAIFLHCKPSGGAGCIAISQEAMITVLQNIQPGCLIVIDTKDNIMNY